MPCPHACTANVRPGPTVRGVLSGWGGLPAMHDQTPRKTLTLKAGQFIYRYNVTQYPLLPDPFPLGLHALPLGLLDRACTQAGPTRSLESRVAQHRPTFTHASLINESSAALTNFPTPAVLCIGPACKAGLGIDT